MNCVASIKSFLRTMDSPVVDHHGTSAVFHPRTYGKGFEGIVGPILRCRHVYCFGPLFALETGVEFRAEETDTILSKNSCPFKQLIQ